MGKSSHLPQRLQRLFVHVEVIVREVSLTLRCFIFINYALHKLQIMFLCFQIGFRCRRARDHVRPVPRADANHVPLEDGCHPPGGAPETESLKSYRLAYVLDMVW